MPICIRPEAPAALATPGPVAPGCSVQDGSALLPRLHSLAAIPASTSHGMWYWAPTCSKIGSSWRGICVIAVLDGASATPARPRQEAAPPVTAPTSRIAATGVPKMKLTQRSGRRRRPPIHCPCGSLSMSHWRQWRRLRRRRLRWRGCTRRLLSALSGRCEAADEPSAAGVDEVEIELVGDAASRSDVDDGDGRVAGEHPDPGHSEPLVLLGGGRARWVGAGLRAEPGGGVVDRARGSAINRPGEKAWHERGDRAGGTGGGDRLVGVGDGWLARGSRLWPFDGARWPGAWTPSRVPPGLPARRGARPFPRRPCRVARRRGSRPRPARRVRRKVRLVGGMSSSRKEARAAGGGTPPRPGGSGATAASGSGAHQLRRPAVVSSD